MLSPELRTRLHTRLLGMAADPAAYAGKPLSLTYRVDHPGTRMPTWLKDLYPDRMTLVLQHQYRDLAPSQRGFHVDLSFNRTWASLYVPYDSVVAVFSPGTVAQDTTAEVVDLAAFRKKRNVS